MSKAGQLIKQIAGTSDEGVHVCKVLTVEGATCNVEPLNGLAELHGVRLNCVTSSTAGIIITPKINSEVIVHQISKVDSYVAQFSEIEKIDVQIGTFKFSLNGSEMVFNDGNLGLVKIDKLIEKVNRLEDKLKTHQHGYIPYPAGVSGPPVPTTPATALVPPNTTLVFTNTERSELEDTKIKH